MSKGVGVLGFFRRLSARVGGPPGLFPLPTRIFHAVLVISTLALFYNIPLNIVVGLPLVAIASAVALMLVIWLYYWSRVLRQTALSRFIFCIAGNVLFVLNFFLNSGVDGPTGYFFLLMLVITVAVVPVRQYWYWISANVILLFGLQAFQYLTPSRISYTYILRLDRYIDLSSAYLTVVVVVLACFYMIRRRYEQERQLAQQNAIRLLELDAERNKLFSIISHDLRSPLAHIQSYLELLDEVDLSETERREIREKLLSSTRGTLDLVNNVLHWSVSRLSGMGLKRELLPLAALLEPQLRLFSGIAARKHVDLQSQLPNVALVWGQADMVLLMVRNLLDNAIKFTAPGGKILLNASQKEDTCVLSVRDSGNGAPAKLSETIFELNTGNASRPWNETGIGLGLALCREYATLLAGRIWFESHPESGATFFVELPSKPLDG